MTSKVSMISTIKDERDGIEDFLKSVLKQTKRPDEFLISDGGSTDGTFDVLQKYAEEYKWIKVFAAPNANIARGRNLLIRKSRYPLIAVTDAGCRLDENWLKNIIAPFDNEKVDIVAGIFQPSWKDDFQYFQGLVVVPSIRKIQSVLRMSSRSLAFRKQCWSEVGGYPEQYDRGEDTCFNLKLQQRGFLFLVAEDAIVKWQMRKNLRDLFRQYYEYGSWDALSKNILRMRYNLAMVCCFWALMLLTVLVDIRFFLALTALLIIDLVTTAPRIFSERSKIKAFVYGISILTVRRIAYIIGVTFGSLTRK